MDKSIIENYYENMKYYIKFYKITNYQSFVISLLVLVFLRITHYIDLEKFYNNNNKHQNDDFKQFLKIKGIYYTLCHFELLNFCYFYLYLHIMYKSNLFLLIVKLVIDCICIFFRLFSIYQIFYLSGKINTFQINKSKILYSIDITSRIIYLFSVYFSIFFFIAFRKSLYLKKWYKKTYIKKDN